MFHVHVCLLYGLRVASNCVLPGVACAASVANADVRFQLAQTPPKCVEEMADSKAWYTSDTLDHRGQPALEVVELTSGWFRFRYWDGNEFFLEPTGRQVWGVWSEPSSPANNTTYFLGPVFGFLLRLRGIICLHASAVSIDGQAIAFMGDSGAGKSTTAAAFARLGFTVLADDILVLSEESGVLLANPGYPRLRLWPDALQMLGSMSSDLPPLPEAPTGSRLHLDLQQNGYRFQHEPQRLAAIYLLNARSDIENPTISAMPQASALIALIGNTYANSLLTVQLRAAEFTQLAHYVKRVPVRMVQPPADPSALSKLCDAILNDLHSVTQSNPNSEPQFGTPRASTAQRHDELSAR